MSKRSFPQDGHDKRGEHLHKRPFWEYSDDEEIPFEFERERRPCMPYANRIRRIVSIVLKYDASFWKVLVTGDLSTPENKKFWREVIRECAKDDPGWNCMRLGELVSHVCRLFEYKWTDYVLANHQTHSFVSAVMLIKSCRNPARALETLNLCDDDDIRVIMHYAAFPNEIDADLQRFKERAISLASRAARILEIIEEE